MEMDIMSGMRRDFLASNLRSQLNRLRCLLDAIEYEDKIGCDYTYESIKEVEGNLRQLRKLCINN